MQMSFIMHINIAIAWNYTLLKTWSSPLTPFLIAVVGDLATPILKSKSDLLPESHGESVKTLISALLIHTNISLNQNFWGWTWRSYDSDSQPWQPLSLSLKLKCLYRGYKLFSTNREKLGIHRILSNTITFNFLHLSSNFQNKKIHRHF